MAGDADVLMYGTGADENRVGVVQIRAQVERDWSQSESAAIVLDWNSVSAADPVAWVAADGRLEFKMGREEGSLLARASFILEKGDERWLCVHAHFSTPAAGQDEGESF